MPSTKLFCSAFVLSMLFGIAGCAEPRMVMKLSGANSESPPRLWPLPPDVPRYRYAGELTGEENFHPEKGVDRGVATKLFDWLVGLASAKHVPVVLQRPQSGVVDDEGRVYITDVSKGAVFVFDKPAGKLETWEMARINSRFLTPVGITLAGQGDILVSDAELHAVFRLNNKGVPQGEFGTTVLKRPTGLARDAQRGTIYVSDTYAHDIKVFGEKGDLIRTIGQRGEADGEFNFPTHLAFANDRLYVTDTLNSRIQVFDETGKMVGKFGRRGLYVGNLVRPKGIAVDQAENVYVIESLYDQLLVFNKRGETLLALGGEGSSAGQFYLPAGVWADRQNHVYVADMFNGRVTVLEFLGGLR
jgi:DNA-binding beta-propeller fold protein YncE